VLIVSASAAGVVGSGITGSWNAAVRIAGAAGDREVGSELAGALTGDGWEIKAALEVEGGTWSAFQFGGSIDLAGAELAAAATFDPGGAGFEKLAMDLALEIDGWETDVSFDLYPNRSWTDLRVQRELGAYKLDIATRLGASKAFSLDFYRADVEVAFAWCGVPVEVAGRVSGAKGFEWIDVGAAVPLPPSLGWLVLEAEGRFSLAEPKWSFEPALAGEMTWEGRSVSLELFGEVIGAAPLGVDGVSISGVTLDASWDEVWFAFGTSFDSAWNKKVIGHKAYGRSVGVGFEVEGPCDWEASCEAWAYSPDPSALGGGDRTVLTVVIRPAGMYELGLTAAYDGDRLAEIDVEAEVEW